MADDVSSTSAGGSRAPGQTDTTQDVSGISGAQFQEYESPTYDLHASDDRATQPAATPAEPTPVVIPDKGTTRFDATAPTIGERVKIGEEKIEIAPHPTTNRFPWKPVQNPTVPVFGTALQPAETETPGLPVPTPVAEPVESQPPVEPAPEPELPAAPVESPVEAAPEPQTQPEPEAEPEEMAVEEPPELPEPEPAPPRAEQPATPEPPAHKRRSQIYSESTVRVWHVLRRGKFLSILLALFVVAVAAAIIYTWKISNGSFSLRHLPFVDRLLNT